MSPACHPRIVEPMLRYRVLGLLEVADGDGPIPVPSAQQRLLLSMLLLQAGRTVRTSSLIDGLWGDRLPSEPAAALRTQVSRLRRRLGASAGDLVTDDLGYRLHVGGSCLDAVLFEELLAEDRLEDAMALWRGRALGEFADRDFAQAAATRLEELMLGARERQAAKSLGCDRAQEAVADLEVLLTEHPQREHARVLLMKALYSIGRQTDALAVYDTWRRELAERGLEPDPAMAELERRILQHRVPGSVRALPVPTSSFVGREREMTTVAATLDVARVVTLCGPGGAGKTRLALELARRLAGRYPDGVRFCDLSTLRRPAEVIRAVATTVGVRDSAPRRVGDQLVDQLVDQLSGRCLLLVLDNCEHLLVSVAHLVERIVRNTTGIDVLASSRERLGVDGEIIRPVEPLDAAAAMQLYMDRARAVDPAFRLDERSVQEICARLDRLPLAIELAAACMRGISASDLVTALVDPLGLLTLGSRTTARHGSLAAVIEWSYEQLSPHERAAFDRFGVFAGRVDGDLACSVTGASPGVLLRLVDRSLLTSHRNGATQYYLLETLRSYAVSRLKEQRLLDSTRDDHAQRAIDLAEQAAAGLSGPQEAKWAARIARHMDEFRSAHVWLVGRNPEAALQLSTALHQWAFWRGQSEVFRMAEVAAAAGASTGSALLPDVLSSAAVGAWQRGNLTAAEAGALAAGGHRRATEVLADVAFLRGDLLQARRLFIEAAAQAEAADDQLQAVWNRGSAALALHYGGQATGTEPTAVLARAEACGSNSARAFAHFVIGETGASEHELTQAVQLADEVGSDFVSGIAEVSLAAATARRGDVNSGLDHYERAIRAWQQTGAWSPQWVTLRTFTRMLADLGMSREAAILHGATIRPHSGPEPYGADAATMEETATRLLAQLGRGVFEASMADGAALTEADVVKFALDAILRARDAAR